MDRATRELIGGLLAKAREKLAVAQKLFGDDVFFDDVASRAYYGAFHAAQALLKSEGLEADTHQGVCFPIWFALCQIRKASAKARPLSQYSQG